MRILVVSQYFYPEEFKINDLVRDFVKRGYEVTVLTGKPNYPKGKYYEGYRFWGVQKEMYEGAKVIHVPMVRRGEKSLVGLFFNYASFLFFGCWYVLTHKMNYDHIFCWENSPIFQVYPGVLLRWKKNIPMSIWVQDLWPESFLPAVSVKGNGLAMKCLNMVVKNVYMHSDIIFISSPRFIESVSKREPKTSKIIYAPNWAENLFFSPEYINEDKYKDLFPTGFIVMIAGNLGMLQAPEFILQAAKLTQEYDEIKFVFLGDGSRKQMAEEKAKKMGLLDKNVFFFGRYPVTEMPSFFCHADVMLVTLWNYYHLALTLPSRTQSYMASRKPIATMINGTGNDVVEEAKCGMTANAEDYKALAENIIKMYQMPKEKLKELGDNGYNYYLTHFTENHVVETIEKAIRECSNT